MSIQSFSPGAMPRLASTAPARRVQAGGGTGPAAQPNTVQPAQSDANLYLMNRLIGNEQDLGRLNRWGLASPGMLRFAAGGGFRRAIASFLTGIPTENLVRYGQMADMMRINGMQPDWAHLIVDSGVRSPGELSRYAGSDIGAQIQRGIVYAALAAKAIEAAANDGRAYSVPSFDQFAQMCQGGTGLGSVINLGVPQQAAPQP